MGEKEGTVLDAGLISGTPNIVKVDGTSSLAKGGSLVSNSTWTEKHVLELA